MRELFDKMQTNIEFRQKFEFLVFLTGLGMKPRSKKYSIIANNLLCNEKLPLFEGLTVF